MANMATLKTFPKLEQPRFAPYNLSLSLHPTNVKQESPLGITEEGGPGEIRTHDL